MVRKLTAFGILVAVAVPSVTLAQVTGTPSFNAPYRAFAKHEFGGTLSFPSGAEFAIEGQYSIGVKTFDIGIRGGVLNPDVGDTRILLGVSGRQRVISHTDDFPLDGAVVAGLGFQFNDPTVVVIPGGLSLGRRLDLEDSQVSIIPYVQPTVFLVTGGTGVDTQLDFSLGLGADFRLSRVLDARVSVGLGDIEGIAISAVWIR